MGLVDQVNTDIKAAMMAKEKEKLEALRAVKSALLMAASEKGAGGEVTDDVGVQVLQKLVKQRKESAEIYKEQGRQDMANEEIAQAEVIQKYLPEQMSEDEVRVVVQKVIADTGAASPADMGKVMGAAIQQLKGKADGKMISALVKEELNN